VLRILLFNTVYLLFISQWDENGGKTLDEGGGGANDFLNIVSIL
jgi:hypothetical protein